MKSVRLLAEALGAMMRSYPLLLLLLAAGIEFGIARMPEMSAHHHVLSESAVVLLVLAALGLVGVPRFARLELRRLSGIDSIDRMSGEDFERRLAVLFRQLGYRVSTTRASGDFGADLVLERDGTRTVVQAKRWDANVSIEAVYEVVGAKAHYGASEAVAVTNSSFTEAAEILAKDNGVTLVARGGLIEMLASQAARAPRSGLSLAARQILSGARLVLAVLGGICSVVLGLVIACVARRSVRRVVSRHA